MATYLDSMATYSAPGGSRSYLDSLGGWSVPDVPGGNKVVVKDMNLTLGVTDSCRVLLSGDLNYSPYSAPSSRDSMMTGSVMAFDTGRFFDGTVVTISRLRLNGAYIAHHDTSRGSSNNVGSFFFGVQTSFEFYDPSESRINKLHVTPLTSCLYQATEGTETADVEVPCPITFTLGSQPGNASSMRQLVIFTDDTYGFYYWGSKSYMKANTSTAKSVDISYEMEMTLLNPIS